MRGGRGWGGSAMIGREGSLSKMMADKEEVGGWQAGRLGRGAQRPAPGATSWKTALRFSVKTE